MWSTADVGMMERAMIEARACLVSEDVPVGAVVVRDGHVLAGAGNRRERDRDPTAHAEIVALREAAVVVETWRLDGCSLYVTLEPCAMCCGAIVLARIDRVVFGAVDPKAGFAVSLGNLLQDDRLNHRVEVTQGVLPDECGELLREFFRARR